jgi:hypothetical protein
MPRVLCLLLLALAATAQVIRQFGPQLPATGKGSIEGTVVDSATHEPLKKVQVTLGGPVQNQPTAVTDAGGRFSFRDLPSGSFWINAMKPGYNVPEAAFGANPNVQVNLGTDEQKKGIEVSLVPGGSISGRILDEDGVPLRGCSVMAVEPGYEQGRRNLHGAGMGNGTNGKGEYRITGLNPGRYYVFARCQSEVPAPHPLLPRGDPRTPYETYMPKFYGGGLDPSTATRLAVTAGANLEGVDFEVRRIPAFTLHGSIASSDPDAFAGRISVMLFPANRQVRNLLQFASGVDPEKRTFQIHAIPGSYLLVAWGAEDGHSLYAQRAVEIGTTPPDPIELSLSSGAELKGTVQFDSEDRPPMENAQLFLSPVETNFYTPQAHGEINKDGTFTLTGVVPGRWRLMVSGPGYIRSLYLGGQQVSPYDFQIAPGATGPLRVIMGSKLGDINVTISGAAPNQMASVLLYPEDAVRFGTGQERVSAGSDRIEIGGLPPGRYRLLATDTLNPWPILQRPDLLKALESSTQAVDVTEGGKVSATVEVVTREELARLLQEKE